MPSNRNPRSVNDAQHPQVVRGAPRPVIVGSGHLRPATPGMDWRSQSGPTPGVHGNSGYPRRNEHSSNTPKHKSHWKWRIGSIAVSAVSVLSGLAITIVEALNK